MKEVERLQYELATQYVIHQDQRRWGLFGAFLVVQGLLTAAVFAQEWSSLRAAVISGIGVSSTLAFAVVLWRSNHYMDKRETAARLLQNRLRGLAKEEKFWPGIPVDPQRRPPESRSVARRTITLTLVLSGELWGILLAVQLPILATEVQATLLGIVLASASAWALTRKLRYSPEKEHVKTRARRVVERAAPIAVGVHLLTFFSWMRVGPSIGIDFEAIANAAVFPLGGMLFAGTLGSFAAVLYHTSRSNPLPAVQGPLATSESPASGHVAEE